MSIEILGIEIAEDVSWFHQTSWDGCANAEMQVQSGSSVAGWSPSPQNRPRTNSIGEIDQKHMIALATTYGFIR